jgi:hypothetical protein
MAWASSATVLALERGKTLDVLDVRQPGFYDPKDALGSLSCQEWKGPWSPDTISITPNTEILCDPSRGRAYIVGPRFVSSIRRLTNDSTPP